MKKIILTIAAACVSATIFAADANPETGTSKQAEAKYTAVIDERSQKIVDALGLGDTNTAKKVHDIIMAQYRALNDWHNANDPLIKKAKGNKETIAKIEAPLKKMHGEYLAELGQYLSPSQIETVKDKMTYGKVEFTFKGYCVEYPNLSEADKQQVLTFLKEAREEAMDAGSSDEKSAIFNRYKGKINNYLAKQGVHSEKWIKEHAASQTK
ncbi:MAG TPA: DUF3826 domain-containing protein [Verrucomicrobiae bacterium]|nr:DUF3826 domain-containing protein [Verrucomicrobiae bacterium]